MQSVSGHPTEDPQPKPSRVAAMVSEALHTLTVRGRRAHRDPPGPGTRLTDGPDVPGRVRTRSVTGAGGRARPRASIARSRVVHGAVADPTTVVAPCCSGCGGRPFTMTPAKVRLAMASMGKPDTKVNELCKELGISRQTLYRHVSPNGEARPDGARVLARK